MTISFAPAFAPSRLWTVGRQRLGFAFSFDAEIVEDPETDLGRTAIVTYAFRLLDGNDRELLAYHWHPRGISPVVHPHLHISSLAESIMTGGTTPEFRLSNLHVPTGHVTIADIVRFLIAEIGVEPRRADWMDVLAAVGV